MLWLSKAKTRFKAHGSKQVLILSTYNFFYPLTVLSYNRLFKSNFNEVLLLPFIKRPLFYTASVI